MRAISPYQFAVARVAVAGWLMATFASLALHPSPLPLNYGGFARFDAFFGVFHVTRWFESETSMRALLWFLVLASLTIGLGWVRRVLAFGLWYMWIALFLTQAETRTVAAYLGEWLLFVLVILPPGEPQILGWSATKRVWKAPSLVMMGSWYVLVTTLVLSCLNEYAQSRPLSELIWHLLAAGVAILGTWPRARSYAWLITMALVLGLMIAAEGGVHSFSLLICGWFGFDHRWFRSEVPDRAVVFFDGVCGICNQFVDFLMVEDDRQLLCFAPLQGETALTELGSETTNSLSSVVFVRNGETWFESDAACRILMELGGIWALARLCLWLPRSTRDGLYRLVARHRYRVFGKKDACRVPSSDEMARFLP